MAEVLETKFGKARVGDIGYYRISSHKEGNYGKLLHRLVFEDFYKIKLPQSVLIHHEDKNPLNNEIWNLVPMTRAEHAAIHMKKENNHQYKEYPRIIKNGYYKGEQVYAIRYNGERIMRSVDLDKLEKKLVEMIN